MTRLGESGGDWVEEVGESGREEVDEGERRLVVDMRSDVSEVEVIGIGGIRAGRI